MKTSSRFLVALLLLGAIFGGIFGYKFLVQFQPPAGAGEPRPANITAARFETGDCPGHRNTAAELPAVAG